MQADILSHTVSLTAWLASVRHRAPRFGGATRGPDERRVSLPAPGAHCEWAGQETVWVRCRVGDGEDNSAAMAQR